MQPTSDYGYCQCGCGQKTGLSKQNFPARGYKKGDPVRFRPGHSTRVKNPKKRKVESPELALPRGQCQCGCGRATSIAKRTDSAKGIINGEPYPYFRGHGPNRKAAAVDGTKRCSRCKRTLRIEEFSTRPPRKDRKKTSSNPMSRCKACASWLTHRIYGLEKRYGITQGEYDQILKSQEGKCAICNAIETAETKHGGIKRLAVDHCHTTGTVRGLLCSNCNNGLGRFKENPELLRLAIDYLAKASKD